MRARRSTFALIVAASGSLAGNTFAGPTSGDLFYTTFRAPNPAPIGPPFLSDGTVNKVTYSFDGTNLTLSNNTEIHNFGTASNSDGIAFALDGDILIGGGDVNQVHKVTTGGTLVGSANTTGGNAYHLGLSPDGNTVYTAGLPGGLSSIPLNPFGDGTTHTLTGDDTDVTQIAFDGSGNAYYTASDAFGNGTFGTIDLNTFVTTRTMSDVPAAHGMAWDAFTGRLILAGDNHISMVDPADTSTLTSDLEVTLPVVNQLVDHFDQVSVDGQGHLFAAINNGNLFFLDYETSGDVNNAGNVQQTQFLKNFLDDIAPLSGPGAPPDGTSPPPPPPPPPPGPNPIPLPAAVWPGIMLLGGLAGASAKRRRQK